MVTEIIHCEITCIS